MKKLRIVLDLALIFGALAIEMIVLSQLGPLRQVRGRYDDERIN